MDTFCIRIFYYRISQGFNVHGRDIVPSSHLLSQRTVGRWNTAVVKMDKVSWSHEIRTHGLIKRVLAIADVHIVNPLIKFKISRYTLLQHSYNIGNIINPSHVIIISTGVRFTASLHHQHTCGHTISPNVTITIFLHRLSTLKTPTLIISLLLNH